MNPENYLIHNPSFTGIKLETGLLFDNSNNIHPTILFGYKFMSSGYPVYFNDDEDAAGTHFIFNHAGCATIQTDNHKNTFTLEAGMFASVPGKFNVFGGAGIIVKRLHYNGVFSIGGPIEKEGRLKYIDGCTDSLLIPPVKMGDPCFNHLHFPPNIRQTQHTHPSMRVGMVVKGEGLCVTPFGNVDLKPGTVFIIHENYDEPQEEFEYNGIKGIPGTHSFHTFGESMDVIAYHPDSDFGPQDENHPMINRTIVQGVSAAKLDDIRTK